MFLDRYSKANPIPAASEGTSFAQKGGKSAKTGKGGKDDKDSDKKKDESGGNRIIPMRRWSFLSAEKWDIHPDSAQTKMMMIKVVRLPVS